MDVLGVPLGSPPRIHAAGPGVHGLVPVERYRLPGFYCINFLQGRGVVTVDGEAYPIRPGYVNLTWPGVDIEYRYDDKAILTWVHFVPAEGAALVPFPVMQDLGSSFGPLRVRAAEIARLYRSDLARAEARLWDLLWDLARPARSAATDRAPHPALQRALDIIGKDLTASVPVRELASRIGVSQTHLNRLFASAFGATVTGYVRGLRMRHAQHLLEHSDLPIKQIAHQVGIGDLHLFNKTVRRAFGQSPTALRARAHAP